jgi:hypothetical protein
MTLCNQTLRMAHIVNCRLGHQDKMMLLIIIFYAAYNKTIKKQN